MGWRMEDGVEDGGWRMGWRMEDGGGGWRDEEPGCVAMVDVAWRWFDRQ
jgi:hypothetical protein